MITKGNIQINQAFADKNIKKFVKAIISEDTDQASKMIDAGISIDHKGKNNITPLIYALLKNNKGAFTRLLDMGADANLQATTGDSAMSLSAGFADIFYLKAILKHQGNPNLVNPHSSRTPIYEGILGIHPENVELLATCGANLNHQDKNGNTPVISAAGINRYDMVYILIKAGANWKLANKHGKKLSDRIKENTLKPDLELAKWMDKVVELLE